MAFIKCSGGGGPTPGIFSANIKTDSTTFIGPNQEENTIKGSLYTNPRIVLPSGKYYILLADYWSGTGANNAAAQILENDGTTTSMTISANKERWFIVERK